MRTSPARGLSALCLLALCGAAAAATLYRWVDAQGVVHYSDTPQPGAETLNISGAQTYHGTQGPASPSPGAPQASAPAGYDTCAITQPAPESSLFAPESVAVSVQVSPALHDGDQVTVQVDGESLQPIATNAATFHLPQPERGTHTVSAQVRNADGEVLCSAPPVSFTVQRPSVNSPQSPVKPH